ncbi:MAG: patatin-like phospholipase family protein [Acidimicrobiales bacterium]
MSERQPKVGLVLGGGGMAGYAFHCSILATLEQETGFDPRTAEIMVGTSAGAIAAAILRGDVPVAEIRDRLLAAIDDPDQMPELRLLAGGTPKTVPRIWGGPGAPTMAVRELRRGRKMQLSKVLAAMLPQGRSPLSPVTERIEKLHSSEWPERPLWIPATNQQSGRLAVFGRDREAPVAKAVEASAALPVYFAPVKIGKRSYVDGGIGSPFNADLLVDYRTGTPSDGEPLDLVIVLAPLSVDELRKKNPFASVARSLPRRRLLAECRAIKAAGTDVLIIQPDALVAKAMGLNPMDPDRVKSIVAQSDVMMTEQLSTTAQGITDLLKRAANTLVSPTDVAYPPIEPALP